LALLGVPRQLMQPKGDTKRLERNAIAGTRVAWACRICTTQAHYVPSTNFIAAWPTDAPSVLYSRRRFPLCVPGLLPRHAFMVYLHKKTNHCGQLAAPWQLVSTYATTTRSLATLDPDMPVEREHQTSHSTHVDSRSRHGRPKNKRPNKARSTMSNPSPSRRS